MFSTATPRWGRMAFSEGDGGGCRKNAFHFAEFFSDNLLRPPRPLSFVICPSSFELSPMSTHWLADRTRLFDASGIRKVFDLGAKLTNPINFSIGQPDFDVPEPVRRAAIDAIESRKNGYALSQGMPVLREKLQAQLQQQYGLDDREVFVASGTSGGLMLALLVLVNPARKSSSSIRVSSCTMRSRR